MSYTGRWSGDWDGAWEGGAARPPGFMVGRVTLGITGAGRLTNASAPEAYNVVQLAAYRRRTLTQHLRRRREDEELLVALM
jgi:hypothetical protein